MSGKNGFLSGLAKKFKRLKEDLKADSVAGNPRVPVDCCEPRLPSPNDKARESRIADNPTTLPNE